VVAVSDGADIDAFWTQHVEWVSVALERFAHAMLAGDWRPEVARPGGHSFPRLAAGDLYRLGTTLLSAQGAAGAPGRLSTACLVAGVRDSIETAISRALAGIEAWSWQPRSTRSQVRIVRRADEYLREHRARPIYTNELCDVVGVSPRTLHSAFAALYGCSPHAYLKRRRLLMVHRVLQASEGALLVKTAALDHGFWHLGNFARDYRALFGVVPTVTRGAFAVTRG
jgi:AraC-like DNA-binding protein